MSQHQNSRPVSLTTLDVNVSIDCLPCIYDIPTCIYDDGKSYYSHAS
jgi:hypothetical protein